MSTFIWGLYLKQRLWCSGQLEEKDTGEYQMSKNILKLKFPQCPFSEYKGPGWVSGLPPKISVRNFGFGRAHWENSWVTFQIVKYGLSNHLGQFQIWRLPGEFGILNGIDIRDLTAFILFNMKKNKNKKTQPSRHPQK